MKRSSQSEEKLRLYLAKFCKNGVWKNSNSTISCPTTDSNLNGEGEGNQRDTCDHDSDNDMSMHLVPSLKAEVLMEEPESAGTCNTDSYFSFVNEELPKPNKSRADNEASSTSSKTNTDIQQKNNSIFDDSSSAQAQAKAQKYERLFRKVLLVQAKKTKMVHAQCTRSRSQKSTTTFASNPKPKPFIDKRLVISVERLQFIDDLVRNNDQDKDKDKEKKPRKSRLRNIKIVDYNSDDDGKQKTKKTRKDKKDQTDNNNEPLLCHLCASSFVSSSALKSHIRWSHKDNENEDNDHDLAGQNIFEKTICTICGKSLSVTYINYHMATVHTNINQKVPCTFEGCDKVFITRRYMLSHLRYHLGYKRKKKQIFKKRPKTTAGENHRVPCPDCKILVLDIYMRNHLGCFHGLDHAGRIFNCPIDHCTAKANSRKEINIHVKCDHEDYARTMGLFDKPFKCTYPQCDKSFAYNHTLNDHIKSHTDPNQTTCPVCGKNVKSPMYLKIHIKDVHGEKNLVCPVENCNHRFSLATNLKKHLKKFHQRDSILRKKDNVQAYIDKFVRLKKQNEFNPGLESVSTETINATIDTNHGGTVDVQELSKLHIDDWVPNQKSARGRKRRE